MVKMHTLCPQPFGVPHTCHLNIYHLHQKGEIYANLVRKEELENGVYGLSIIITMSTTSRTSELPSKLKSDATNSR